jgi:hypothetical protein
MSSPVFNLTLGPALLVRVPILHRIGDFALAATNACVLGGNFNRPVHLGALVRPHPLSTLFL